MAKKIKADNIASEITTLLTKYSDNISEEMKKVVDECTEGVMNEVKQHVDWHDKKYSKSFKVKNTFEDKRNKRNTWYVQSPHYRLTHLLEFGHVTRNGQTRTRAYPHVKYGDEYLNDNFFKKMGEALEKCKI